MFYINVILQKILKFNMKIFLIQINEMINNIIYII